MAFNVSYLFDRVDLIEEGMTQLLEWFENKTIVAPPVTTYPLADVARAHADIESGKTVGKLVLVP
jgi:NADPH2:quinone reductase